MCVCANKANRFAERTTQRIYIRSTWIYMVTMRSPFPVRNFWRPTRSRILRQIASPRWNSKLMVQSARFTIRPPLLFILRYDGGYSEYIWWTSCIHFVLIYVAARTQAIQIWRHIQYIYKKIRHLNDDTQFGSIYVFVWLYW